MTTKEILFRASQKRPDATIPFRRAATGCAAKNDIIGWGARLPVNLDALSPVARFIAEHTSSTFNSGSIMRCTSRKTEAELLAKQGEKPERIDALRRGYGDMIDEPVVQDLAYGTLEPGVTPEAFLEKVAARVAHCSRLIRMDRDGYPTLQKTVEMAL